MFFLTYIHLKYPVFYLGIEKVLAFHLIYIPRFSPIAKSNDIIVLLH